MVVPDCVHEVEGCSSARQLQEEEGDPAVYLVIVEAEFFKEFFINSGTVSHHNLKSVNISLPRTKDYKKDGYRQRNVRQFLQSA